MKSIGGKMGFIDSNVVWRMCYEKRFLYPRHLFENLMLLELLFRDFYDINISCYELKKYIPDWGIEISC